MRGTLDINRESNIHAAARTMQTPISIHALHEESDESDWYLSLMWTFQSTLSMRRATLRGHVDRVVQPISIHALHEESDVTSAATRSACSIFQSTLSMRRATSSGYQCSSPHIISIHALHEESDLQPLHIYLRCATFQSTLSMRRATVHANVAVDHGILISIHALHEESDSRGRHHRHDRQDFNPRSP